MAGVASIAPAAFTARTCSSCEPAIKPSITCVASQEPHEEGVTSSEHSKVASGSSEEKVKLAVGLTVLVGGPDSMVVSGTTVAEPVATPKGDRLPGSPHTMPLTVS